MVEPYRVEVDVLDYTELNSEDYIYFLRKVSGYRIDEDIVVFRDCRTWRILDDRVGAVVKSKDGRKFYNREEAIEAYKYFKDKIEKIRKEYWYKSQEKFIKELKNKNKRKAD